VLLFEDDLVIEPVVDTLLEAVAEMDDVAVNVEEALTVAEFVAELEREDVPENEPVPEGDAWALTCRRRPRRKKTESASIFIFYFESL